jgi:hypothetical protein
MPADLKFSCPHCAQPLEVSPEAAGALLPCPTCQREIQAPSPPAQTGASLSVHRCAFCLTDLAETDDATSCPQCQTKYHAECWTENGGCAVYGCSRGPTVEARRAIEIPVSYWGRENKPCPACGKEILAAAMRCRHCGATFDSARPQDAAEFQERTVREQRLPGTRKMVICLFIFCVIPCLAPIGAIWGAVWYPQNRQDVAALPSIYGALCKIGLGVAVIQVGAVFVLALLYFGLRGAHVSP